MDKKGRLIIAARLQPGESVSKYFKNVDEQKFATNVQDQEGWKGADQDFGDYDPAFRSITPESFAVSLEDLISRYRPLSPVVTRPSALNGHESPSDGGGSDASLHRRPRSTSRSYSRSESRSRSRSYSRSRSRSKSRSHSAEGSFTRDRVQASRSRHSSGFSSRASSRSTSRSRSRSRARARSLSSSRSRPHSKKSPLTSSATSRLEGDRDRPPRRYSRQEDTRARSSSPPFILARSPSQGRDTKNSNRDGDPAPRNRRQSSADQRRSLSYDRSRSPARRSSRGRDDHKQSIGHRPTQQYERSAHYYKNGHQSSSDGSAHRKSRQTSYTSPRDRSYYPPPPPPPDGNPPSPKNRRPETYYNPRKRSHRDSSEESHGGPRRQQETVNKRQNTAPKVDAAYG